MHDNLKTSPVVPFTSHIAQRRYAFRSFPSHPFHIKLMPANNDSHRSTLTEQVTFPIRQPGLSTTPLLTYRSRYPPSAVSAHQPRLMAVHSEPYQAAQSCRHGIRQDRRAIVKNEQLHLSSRHLRSFPPPRSHMYTTRTEDRRITDELLSWPLEGKFFHPTPAYILAANLTT